MQSTLLLSLLALAAPDRISFVADDYAGARATAVARKLPLFVEVWAPW